MEGQRMTRDDIIRLAREVADKDTVDPVHGDPPFIVLTPDEMIQFAALVAAAEREEILKLADSLGWVDVDHIRARGDK